MNRADSNFATVLGVVLVLLILFGVAYWGTSREEDDHESGYCKPIEQTQDRVHWQCQDGRDYWRMKEHKINTKRAW